MDQAEELFAKLQSFGNAKDFLEYCNQVLGTVERIHVDFKEKHDRRIPKLEDGDKRNLAKAVSGFANSGGGVLIWGIEDETLKPKPITNIQKFMQNLLQLAPQVTDPFAEKIDGHWIVSNSESGEGFGILFIPESTLPPHRVILSFDEIKNHYYVRSGNSFIVASHTMLEDMFGRRPRPELALAVKYRHSGSAGKDQQWLTIILGIENSGRGIAKSPFLEVNISPPFEISNYGIDGNGNFGMPPLANSAGSTERRYGSTQSLAIHSGITHDVAAIRIELFLSTAKSLPDVLIDYKIAAEGVQLVTGKKTIRISEILSELGYLIE